jgi:hypothetical protein
MHPRRHIAPLLALLLILLAAAPVAAQPEGPVQLYWSEVIADGRQVIAPAPSAPARPCSDRAYNLDGGRWTKTLKWSFRASSTPSGLARSAALRVIKRSYGNIVNARNDCGRPDRVGATASYLGTTSAKPSCSARDKRNVVGFRSLPSDMLARTCWWVSGNRIIEADIQINNKFSWATSLAGCRFQPMLEAVMTHEVGHAFGMGHVGEKKHGRLTMSTRLDGNCNNQEATLGLGDLLGLEKLY